MKYYRIKNRKNGTYYSGHKGAASESYIGRIYTDLKRLRRDVNSRWNSEHLEIEEVNITPGRTVPLHD